MSARLWNKPVQCGWKWAKDKHSHGLCFKQGSEHPSPSSVPIMTCWFSQEIVSPWESLGWARSSSTTSSVVFVVGHRRSCGSSHTHIGGLTMGLSKLCPVRAASVCAAEVLTWELTSFYLNVAKLKKNQKVKKNESRKKSWSSPLGIGRNESWSLQ